MDDEKLFALATPYLKNNDFGVSHTRRVYDIAKQSFSIKPELEELTFASIILHDIGGSSIRDQYEKGPQIAALLLRKMCFPDSFISEVCSIISTHHEHPDNPSEPFQVLYDSDKMVMFSKEEFSHYNSKKDFDWNNIINLIYSEKGKRLAKEWLAQRKQQ